MSFTDLDICVRSSRAEMIDFTSQLVAIASENPPGIAYPDCVRASSRGSRARSAVRNRSTIGRRTGTRDGSGAGDRLEPASARRRTLYFSGHYDVVPVTTPGQCTPVLKGKTSSAAASADMKSGLAAMLYAAVALSGCACRSTAASNWCSCPTKRPAGSAARAFSPRRSAWAIDGIGMLTPEPTSGVVWNANRGAITYA